MNVRIWLQAGRPKTLGAAVAPVIIGSAMAYADKSFHAPSSLLALVGAVLIQVGTNYANDYFDYKHGADARGRLGPLRATQAGIVAPKAMKRAFLMAFAGAAAAGIYLIARGGFPILIIGILSIICGILYTGGNYPLAYYGLGDIFVLVFFGPVAVGGTYYVQSLTINWLVIAMGLIPGLISVAILTVNNLRDIETDKNAGKRTVAVRFGRRYTRFQYLFFVMLACFVPLFMFIYTGVRPFSLISCCSILFAVKPIKTVFQDSAGAELNQTLAETSLLNIVMSILFSIGWIL